MIIEQENHYGSPDPSRPVTVLYAGSEQCAPAHRWEGVRDHYLLHYVTSGTGYVWRRGRRESLYPGGCFFFGPMERLRYEADGNRPWAYMWVGFAGTHAASLFGEYVRVTGSEVAQLPLLDCLRQHLVGILDALRRRTGGSTTRAAGLLEVFVGSAIDLAVGGKPGARETVDPISAAVEFIDLNFQRRMRVADVATRVGVDRSHLSRLFHRRRGVTIQEYMITRRMNRARDLLRQTTLPMRAVAASVGYDSYVSFERRFADRVGMPPTAWREQSRDA
ncbi:MAG: AraC family transcriptional regulator [Spirochaetales bacterium]|nr:AraC family transcriptional regulator [Spirochaetales bacterium]